MKHILITLLAVMSFYAMPLWAHSCSNHTSTTLVSVPSFTVQRDVPIGSRIGGGTTMDLLDIFDCPHPEGAYQYFGIKSDGNINNMIAGHQVYNTNIPRIGYSVGAVPRMPGCNGGDYYIDGIEKIDGEENSRVICKFFSTLAGGQRVFSVQVQIWFYKTASVTGTGTVAKSLVGSFILHNHGNRFQRLESVIYINDFNVTTLACSLGNASILVPMGNIKTTAFSGVGSSPAASNTQNFNIPLSCDIGTHVWVQLDGTTVKDTPGVLALDSADSSGVATGVGIQVLSNNEPVMFGRWLDMGKPTSAGTYNIPLQARYYQTEPTITAGTANSSASFTLTYQ